MLNGSKQFHFVERYRTCIYTSQTWHSVIKRGLFIRWFILILQCLNVKNVCLIKFELKNDRVQPVHCFSVHFFLEAILFTSSCLCLFSFSLMSLCLLTMSLNTRVTPSSIFHQQKISLKYFPLLVFRQIYEAAVFLVFFLLFFC